jgi:hypothetical protein
MVDEPDKPKEPALAVFIATAPEDDSEPNPLVNTMEPPVLALDEPAKKRVRPETSLFDIDPDTSICFMTPSRSAPVESTTDPEFEPSDRPE